MNQHEWPQRPGSSGALGGTGALDGLKVLDLSRVLSGPFATMGLADLAEDVIKVEAPNDGDDTRQWEPPFQGDQTAYFLSVNRNKRSVVVDLKTSDGLRAVKALTARADGVVENFRPGVMKRLGLGYDDLCVINPVLIYASISGFGQTGPDSRRPGYDAVVQARSGIMSVTGEPGRPGVRVGVTSADLAAGMWAMVGILAALVERQSSGRGQWVDVALLDTQASLLTYVAGSYFATGVAPGVTAHPIRRSCRTRTSPPLTHRSLSRSATIECFEPSLRPPGWRLWSTIRDSRPMPIGWRIVRYSSRSSRTGWLPGPHASGWSSSIGRASRQP